MVVLDFLTDPDVVAKILRRLGLPTCPPPLTPACSSAGQALPVQQLPLYSSPAQENPLPQTDGDAGADRPVGEIRCRSLRVSAPSRAGGGSFQPVFQRSEAVRDVDSPRGEVDVHAAQPWWRED
jgi:hypothetical protein